VKDWVEFVDVESFLPAKWANTRSSDTIEWHLENLKTLMNLTDPLITLNDDWLVVNRFDLVAHANEFTWCEEPWGSTWGYGKPDIGTDTFIESIATVNRAIRDAAWGKHDYKPGNIISHLPVVLWSRTVDIVRRHFNLDQTHSMTRTNTNLQFEYMLAQVERHFLGGNPRKSCKPSYNFVPMVGPLLKLRAGLCSSLKSSMRNTFICLNDDIDTQFLASEGDFARFKSTITDFLDSLVARKQELSSGCR
jgi:hypothetical protein